MQSVRPAPRTSACFMEEEIGASPMEHLLVASIIAVILGLMLLAIH